MEMLMLEKEAKPTPQNAQVRKVSKVSKQKRSILADAPAGKLTLQQGEPADAFVTGGSRSLQRRCLGLNIPFASALAPLHAAKGKKPVARPQSLPAR